MAAYGELHREWAGAYLVCPCSHSSSARSMRLFALPWGWAITLA